MNAKFGQKQYQGISSRAKTLLEKSEGYDVDFKRDAKVDVDDLIAFANSPDGGTLLLGIDEIEDENGIQKGQICGCDVGDKTQLSIQQKAISCIPQIDISIHLENLDSVPFYRVEIPSSQNKPHCSQKGTYKIRSDGQNKALTPQEILKILLEKEQTKFEASFLKVSKKLEENFQDEFNTLISLQQDDGATVKNVETVPVKIEKLFKDVRHLYQQADSHATINTNITDLKRDNQAMNLKLDAILHLLKASE